MRVTKKIEFCSGHRLYGYNGPCGNLHGHNYIALVCVEGDQDSENCDMVVDFGDLSRMVKSYVDSNWDHKVLLKVDDPLRPLLEKEGQLVTATLKNPTAETMAGLLYEAIESWVDRKTTTKLVSVTIYETPTSCATASASGQTKKEPV